MSENTS